MKKHIFYKKYSNMPLNDRYQILSYETGLMTLSDVYSQIKKLDNEMRPKKIEQDELLQIAEEYFNIKKLK